MDPTTQWQPVTRQEGVDDAHSQRKCKELVASFYGWIDEVGEGIVYFRYDFSPTHTVPNQVEDATLIFGMDLLQPSLLKTDYPLEGIYLNMYLYSDKSVEFGFPFRYSYLTASELQKAREKADQLMRIFGVQNE